MDLLAQLSRIILNLMERHPDGSESFFDSGAHECFTGQLDSLSEIHISTSDMRYSGDLTSSRHQRYPRHFLGHFRVRHHPRETHLPILWE